MLSITATPMTSPMNAPLVTPCIRTSSPASVCSARNSARARAIRFSLSLSFSFRLLHDTLTFLIPPFLELLFNLDIMQVVLCHSRFAHFILFGLLLLEDRGEGELGRWQ